MDRTEDSDRAAGDVASRGDVAAAGERIGARGLRLLFVAMYDPGAESSAPRVRIRLLGDALARHPAVAGVTRLEGGSRRRLGADLRWIAARGWRNVDGIYVEAPTSPAMPWDLAMLASARAAGLPVAVYFRDAYQRFRRLYPRTSPRQILTDPLWRVTTPLLAGLASTRFVPSRGLGRVLGLDDARLLPPGTDPSAPDLGAGEESLVGYVGGLGPEDGFDMLVEAMAIVRRSCPDARLLVVSKAQPSSLPEWVELVRAGRSELPAALGPARLCVIPRPINAYSDLAVPVKLMDYMSFGKPTVTTAAAETAAIVEETGAGIVAGAGPAAGEPGLAAAAGDLAAAIVRLLSDRGLASDLGRRARAAATDPRWTWDGRAQTIIESIAGRRRAEER